MSTRGRQATPIRSASPSTTTTATDPFKVREGRAAEAILLTLLVLLPTAVNPYGGLAFEPVKSAVVRVGAAVLAAAWLWANPRVSSTQPLVRAWLALLVAATVSTISSIEPLLSLADSFDRGMGWVTLAACTVVLVCGADTWRDERRRERAITALLVGGMLPCAYALTQRVGLDPMLWTTSTAMGSTFGSPTFLGSFVVLLVPFAAYRIMRAARNSATWQYAAWLAVLLMLAATVVLATIRGPLLGLVVAAATFALVSTPRRRVALLGVATLIALALALAAAIALSEGDALRGFERYLTIGRLGDSSVERLTVWADAARLPLEHPLRVALGFGPESQAAVLERAEATIRLTQNQRWDRAHNVVLDTWLTGGGLGVLTLLGVYVAAVQRSLAAPDRLLRAALVGALFGHIVEASFAFETPATLATLSVVLALAVSTANTAATPRRLPGAARKGFALAALLATPALALPAVADARYGAGQRAYVSGDVRSAAEVYEEAATLAPWVEELPRVAGLAWLELRDHAAAEWDLMEAARRAPHDPFPRLRLVRLHLQQGDLERAETACQAAQVAGPYRAVVWDRCADVSSARGRRDEVIERRARAEALR